MAGLEVAEVAVADTEPETGGEAVAAPGGRAASATSGGGGQEPSTDGGGVRPTRREPEANDEVVDYKEDAAVGSQ